MAKVFELYYEAGASRSLLDLSSQLNIPFEMLREWSEAYAWEEKINERNKEMDRMFEEAYKSKSREIRNRLITQMESMLTEMDSCSLGLPFNVSSVADLRQLAQAYESLVRANNQAITGAKDALHGGAAPKTWSDLLHQAEGVESKVERQEEEGYDF